jgi:hypothetical protein
MLRERADDLLNPGYLPLESGYQRLEDGSLFVANLTMMPGCKGAMVDWWFGYLRTDEHYRRWHPRDHVSLEWDEKWRPGHYVGATHRVCETIGGELRKLKIRFLDPSELLDTSRFEEARVSGVVYGRTGLLDVPVWTGHVLHLCRDTDLGCEMRSRFWLGDFDPPDLAPSREKKIELLPDGLGRGLLQHCVEEMRILAAFLPQLHSEEKSRGKP